MAAQLLEFYDRALKEFGLSGRVKLALLTKISSEKAQTAADSPENIEIFQRALAQIKQSTPAVQLSR